MLRTPEFYETIDRIREHLDAKYAAREEALKLAREVVRAAANAVRAAHRGEFGTAEALLAEGHQKLQAATDLLAEHPDVLWAGFIGDAAKELVEAYVTLAVIAGRPIPGPEELNVEPLSYLQGLAEAVGELRRHLLDLIRTGRLGRAEEILGAMDAIYEVLVALDYPDGMTGGLRRLTDQVRGILERSRGDLTLSIRQWELAKYLGTRDIIAPQE
jgi:translin